jgi:hypothetical protein
MKKKGGAYLVCCALPVIITVLVAPSSCRCPRHPRGHNPARHCGGGGCCRCGVAAAAMLLLLLVVVVVVTAAVVMLLVVVVVPLPWCGGDVGAGGGAGGSAGEGASGWG